MRNFIPPFALLIGCLMQAVGVYAQRVMPIGTGVTASGSVGIYAMEEAGGTLYVGGRFNTFNGTTGYNIHSWDGEQAVHLEGAFTSLTQFIRTLALYNGDLIAGGSEADFGNVARWDGVGWNVMGTGLPGQVHALAVFEGELYAGGAFNGVSRWDGSDWVEVGVPFNGVVERLAVYQGQLYAGGSFTADADEVVDLKCLVRWNGTDWEQVLAGLNGSVAGLVGTPQGLIVGGGFTADGDESQNLPNWTIFDGASFSEETFMPGVVTNVTAMPDGGSLLATQDETHRWRDGSWERIAMPRVNTARSFGGYTVIAGQGSANWLPGLAASGIGYLLDGDLRATLDASDIAAEVDATLDMFRDGSIAGFEAPKGGGVGSIYNATPWIAARQGTDLWEVFSPTNGSQHIANGPHADTMDMAFLERYNQVWKLERTLIDAHIAQWDQPGYVMPYVIATWPGNGDVSNGEPAVLAPFADLNANDIYEPEQGEYPLIRGDMAVYNIQHTVPTSGGDVPRADIHMMHYAFADPTDPSLYNTVFTNFRVVNRGVTEYDQMRFGVYADFDIGCGTDDFAECDPDLDLFFAFNGDPFDEDCFGSPGYGEDPPAQGAAFLSKPLDSHRAIIGMSPMNPLDGILGLQNGQPFDYGAGPTNLQFPGGPNTDAAEGNAPGERKSVGATGPYPWNVDEVLCFDMAFVFAQRNDPGDPSVVDILKTRVATIRNWYDAREYSCVGVITDIMDPSSTVSTLQLFPNPTAGSVTLQRPNGTGPAELVLTDATGAIVLHRNWPAATPTQVLDLQGLANGLYIVQVMDTNGRQQQRLLKTGY